MKYIYASVKRYVAVLGVRYTVCGGCASPEY
jgi:hypothetical protein